MPKVSVIIPIYNVEQYLRKCLGSVINQTLKDIEIICVNDGSTDGSLQILQEYEQKDDRIKIIDKANSGYGDSMNKGLDAATGEYIGIVEPDDYIDKDMYLVLHDVAIRNNVDFVKSDFYRFTGEKENEKLFYNKIDSTGHFYNRVVNPSKELKSFEITINTWTGIYNRNFLNENNIRHNTTPGASFQDSGFWFQTFICANKAYFLDKPFYRNRRDNENSSIYDKTKIYTIAKEYDFIYEILSQNMDKFNIFIDMYYYKRFMAYSWNYDRLSVSNKLEFIKYFSNEFKQYQKQGKLNFEYFSKKQEKLLKSILNHPYLMYITHRKSLWQNSLIEEVFSLKNEYKYGQKYKKVITILGLKFKFKVRNSL